MKKLVILSLLVSGTVFGAVPVCQDLTLCNDQISALQAQQAVADRQIVVRIAQIQASIAAMPSPSPSPSPTPSP